ncbi:MAG: hypothetical protein AAF559_05345 [Pseudomonadota bacterium]
MMMTASRLRQIGWGALLGVCIAAFAVLSLTVHAVRSEVLVAEMKIVRLKQQKQKLETEFQSRASQHKLAHWNSVDMGFVAPRADQYMDTGTQLAQLGLPAGPRTPSPIRVARADAGDGDGFIRVSRTRKMVSPLTGKPVTLASMDAPSDAGGFLPETFAELLIEASPIRQAKAQTVTGSSFAGEATE